MKTAIPNVCSLASVLIVSAAALVACQVTPPERGATVTEVSTPAASMPAPQPPFDTTPITPVESAGAAAE